MTHFIIGVSANASDGGVEGRQHAAAVYSSFTSASLSLRGLFCSIVDFKSSCSFASRLCC